MNRSYQNLVKNLDDVVSLLNLSDTQETNEQRMVLFRSCVVLLIASWENFVEQLAESSIKVLTERLRDSSTLPETVKQSISLFSIPEKRSNQQDFSESV